MHQRIEKVSVLVELSEEIQDLLATNDIDLIAALQESGIETRRAQRPADLPPKELGLKSVELIILCSAIAAPLLGTAIARVIDAVNRGRDRRAVVVTERSYVPVRNPAGEIERHADGRPLMEWSEVPVFHEHQQEQEQLVVNIEFMGLKVSLGDRDRDK